MTAARVEPARKQAANKSERGNFLRGPSVAAALLAARMLERFKEEVKLTLSKPSKVEFPSSQTSDMNFPVACRNNKTF